MTQEDRLDALIEIFVKDSGERAGVTAPPDEAGKRRLLRSLMNVRMPGAMADEAIELQNEYLRGRAEEKGIVDVAGLRSAADEYGSAGRYSDRLCLWQGDITRLDADAIVNAANSQMLGCFVPCHSCIDNAIHTFAGIQLRAECERKMRESRRRFGPRYEQPTAVPMLTDAYNLPAKRIIHVVGPIVDGPLTKRHESKLSECYRSCLDITRDNGLKSIAFCCISTGVFNFPNDRAALIAVNTVREWFDDNDHYIRVVFNVFKDEDKQIYASVLKG